MKSITLSIAGFTILLQSDDGSEIYVEEGYHPFIISDYEGKPDVIVHSLKNIPQEFTKIENAIFEACDHQQKYYTICKKENGYKIIIYNPETNDKVQQIVMLNKDISEWIVYSDQNEYDGKVYPLQYPLGPLVLYYLTVRFDAIMIHASGIDDTSDGRIFCGFSGSGKTTMADLWHFTGSRVINDDRLIIRKENDEYVFYNTPMFYQDKPKKARLKMISIIHHATENTITKINGARAVAGVTAFCVQNNYNIEFIDHHLAFISELCCRIPVYDLGFKPDPNIVDYIKSHAV